MAKIAIMGFGTVGSGVAEVLQMNQNEVRRKTAESVEVKYILDTREFPDSPFQNLVIHDFAIIENDPEVSVVVEAIGGCGVALDFARRALKAGKHVVTSNKALVAAHGPELLELAKAANKNFLFEASVGGGIPVLRPIMFCLAGNQIEEICGILNGTTNYILTKMINENLAFADVLKDAQEKGYAEADPTADVEGLDACRKICILAALAFGQHIYPEQVYTKGITAISPEDIAFADASGMKVKLFGRTYRMEDGKIAIFVSPHFVCADLPLAGVEDVFNAVMVRGNAVGEVMFYGRGAGKLPTASAVVGDVVDCVLHDENRRDISWSGKCSCGVADFHELPLRWFVRSAAPEDTLRAALPGAEPIGFYAGQRGVLTAPMTLAQLDTLQAKGLSVLAAIPVMA